MNEETLDESLIDLEGNHGRKYFKDDSVLIGLENAKELSRRNQEE